MTMTRILTLTMLLAAAAAVAGMLQVRRRLELADTTTADIEDRIDALDPVTRASVISRLGADTAKAVRAHS